MIKYFNEIVKVLKKNTNFLITSHINLDGDAIGSELALYFILKKLNKESIILNQDKLPEIYGFLPESDKIYNLEDNNFNKDNFDVGIVLDCGNIKRAGEVSKILKNTNTIINIDHHGSNENYGSLNYIDCSASSVGEIIYELIKFINLDLLDKKISTCLFTAIMTDTGSFKYSNVSSKTFKIVSDLTFTGMKSYLIANNIYNRNTFSGLKLLGEALLTLEIDDSNYISWLSITRKMLDETKANDEEIEGIIDVSATLKNTEISVLFRETKDNKIKVSFRSKGNFNVSEFSNKFNGGGHPNSAGCLCSGKLEEVKENILSELFKEIDFLKDKIHKNLLIKNKLFLL
ncbi:MAG: bifunctional oligoribonuclease/PAP phosphatase NrnA [Candidatus Atribacteria bacterium]